MAINLNFQAAPITPFTKESPEQKGAEIMRIGNAVSGVIQQQGQLRDEREMLQAQTRQKEINTLSNAKMGDKFYYDGDELENTEYKGQRTERNAAGDEVAKSIPAYEAEPFIRKRDQLENLNNAASGISNWMNRQQFVERGKQQIEDQFARDLEFADKEARLHVRFEVSQQLSELARTGNHGSALDMLDETTVYSDDEKAELRTKLNVDSETFDAKAIVVKPNWSADDFIQAEMKINELGADDYGGVLSQDQRIALINDLQRGMNAYSKSQQIGDSLNSVRYEMYLDRQLQSEMPETKVTESSLWEDFQSGKIDEKAYKRLTGKAIGRDVKEENRLIGITAYASTLQRGFKPAPTPDNQKRTSDLYAHELNKYVNSVGIQNVDPLVIHETGLAIAKSSSMVPTQIQEEWMAANSGDANQLLVGAQQYNEYKKITPEAVSNVSSKNFSTLQNVAARLDLGMSEAAAVQGAIKVRDMSPGEREVQKTVWTEATKGKAGKPLSSTLQADFATFLDSEFSFEPGDVDAERQGSTIGEVPADAVVWYENLTKTYFEQGNDFAVAQKLAQDDFKKVYKMTNINEPNASVYSKLFASGGNQLMAYAPPNDLFTTEQIQKQLVMQFRDKLRPDEKLFVLSDATTLSTAAKGQPVFAVRGVAEDGTPRILGMWSYNQEVAKAVQARVETEERISFLESDIKAGEQAKIDYATNVGGELKSPSLEARMKKSKEELAIQKQRLKEYGN